MSEHPKRENYDSDSDFLDAMADHYGIDRRMLRHIPIPKMIHDDDTCPHLVVLGRLEAENARLKAQIEHLTPSLWLRVVAWLVSFVGAFCLAELILKWMNR